MFSEFDTVLSGRGGNAAMPGMNMFVFSRTQQQRDHPEVPIVSAGQEKTFTSLRGKRGKDIWLFGGGSLFRSLLGAGLVDTIEIAIVLILL
jgi:dihydrofolate reductase